MAAKYYVVKSLSTTKVTKMSFWELLIKSFLLYSRNASFLLGPATS